MLKILADADSLPPSHRSIILRRAVKEKIETVFVADRPLKDVTDVARIHTQSLRDPYRQTLDKEELRKIKSPVRMVVVPTGKNSADDYIASEADENCLVISHDIPLLERAVEKKAFAMDDRGQVYTPENIRQRMSERNNNYIFREMQLFEGKSHPFDSKTLENFANTFDRILTKYS